VIENRLLIAESNKEAEIALAAGHEDHLADILASQYFRTSARSQQFLTHVVRQSLNGRADLLKERVIGEQVFGRSADYDTGQDSIVRVKANEVRRRLAQYYEQHPTSPFRFEMSAGSYAIRVHRSSTPVVPATEIIETKPAPSIDPPPPAPVAPTRFGSANLVRWGLTVFATGVAVVAGYFGISTHAANDFDLFWQPFLNGGKPLFLCVPSPEAFRIYGSDSGALVNAFKPRPPGSANPPIQVSLKDARIIPEPGLLVGLGDAHVISTLNALATLKGREMTWRMSSVTTYADLTASPSVVIGAATNPWHADLVKGGRYQVTRKNGQNVVFDQQTEQSVCVKPFSWEPASSYDCAVLTRLPGSGSSQPLMLAGGLDHYGTYVLGDLLTNPSLLRPALAKAAKGWEKKNLQILVRVERRRDGAGPPQILNVHTW
jgi:hypothetical protein